MDSRMPTRAPRSGADDRFRLAVRKCLQESIELPFDNLRQEHAQVLGERKSPRAVARRGLRVIEKEVSGQFAHGRRRGDRPGGRTVVSRRRDISKRSTYKNISMTSGELIRSFRDAGFKGV